MSLRRRTVAALLCVTGLLVASSVFASVAMSSDNAGAAKATLTVSKVGTGAGLVTSVPAGITCGAVCTGQFAVGTTVELLAHGAAGSTFEAYSENCTRVGGKNVPPGPAMCEVVLHADTSVKAIFNLTPTPCVAPGLKGRTLAKAKFLLALHSCRAGRITLVSSRKVKRDHVLSEYPRAGWQGQHGAPVNLFVSKGIRRSD